jgi:nucleoside-diphosphate-sugar epimerase
LKALVTGGTGFVGNALCAHLTGRGFFVRSAGRSKPVGERSDAVVVGDIGADTDWSTALEGVDQVVHLAARVHIDSDSSRDPLAEYRRVNVEGTRRLASMAAERGVRRFVFLSSAKVNGEVTRTPCTEADPPRPEGAYAVSKWEAEQALTQLASESGMEWVILRPPLVYGPGVRANFLKLMRAVAAGIPLPFASIDNRRSLLYLGNLVDAIRTCLAHPRARDRTFLVSDGDDLSTPGLTRRLAQALGMPARLLPMPVALLSLAGAMTGKGAAVDRLVGSLQLDTSAIRETLGWTPPFGVDQGLQETARWFRRVAGAPA